MTLYHWLVSLSHLLVLVVAWYAFRPKAAEQPGWNFYVLRCRDNKIYVGRTLQTVSERFRQHARGGSMSSQWTRKYKPVSILHSERHPNRYLEDALVVEMMDTHGVANVRGGSYSNSELTSEQLACIRRAQQEHTTSVGDAADSAILLPHVCALLTPNPFVCVSLCFLTCFLT